MNVARGPVDTVNCAEMQNGIELWIALAKILYVPRKCVLC